MPVSDVQHVKSLRVAGLAEPMGHYSDAVLAGDTLYVTGLIGADESGALVGADVGAQARRMFENLGLVLAAAGATARDVARVTVYMCDVTQRLEMNKARAAFFGEHKPASTLIQVAALVEPEVLIEMDAIAVLSGR